MDVDARVNIGELSRFKPRPKSLTPIEEKELEMFLKCLGDSPCLTLGI